MFWMIPLALIAGSFYGISRVVWPKFKGLRRREDLPEIKDDFWRLMLPEFFSSLNLTRSKLKILRINAAADYEKFLRKVRILSLKTDNFINKLLEKRQKKASRPEFKKMEINGQKEPNVYFKTRENNLIAEIAKNPKDKNLYKALGALYLENKMFRDAEEAFNVVLELDPNEDEVKQNLEKIGKMG